MWRTLAILSALLLIAFLVLAQDKQVPPKSNASTPYYTVPLEATRTENPVKPTPESLARGKKQYGYDCAMCHGKEATARET
jgi:cytochrome c5